MRRGDEDIDEIDDEPGDDVLPSGNRPTLDSEVAQDGTASIYYVEEKNEVPFGATPKLNRHRKRLARFAHDGS